MPTAFPSRSMGTMNFASRETFLISPEGKVVKVWPTKVDPNSQRRGSGRNRRQAKSNPYQQTQKGPGSQSSVRAFLLALVELLTSLRSSLLLPSLQEPSSLLPSLQGPSLLLPSSQEPSCRCLLCRCLLCRGLLSAAFLVAKVLPLFVGFLLLAVLLLPAAFLGATLPPR